jgi:large subunit ribosomal protein L3
MRMGLIGQKVGMSRVLTEKGEHIPVTLIHVDNCQVVDVKTTEKHGYNAIQLGVGTPKLKNVSKSLRGYYAKQKIEPKRKLAEFRVNEDALLKPSDRISVAHFVPGQYVDVSGNAIGKGFAGVMKRWNFGGLRASHGVSVSHRSHGSTGQRQDPGRVFKGKKMAGHMGTNQVTVQNLQVVGTDADQNLIIIKGAIPGANGSYVYIHDAVKRPAKETLPYPAALVGGAESKAAPVEEEKQVTEAVQEPAHEPAAEVKAEEAAAPAAEAAPAEQPAAEQPEQKTE